MTGPHSTRAFLQLFSRPACGALLLSTALAPLATGCASPSKANIELRNVMRERDNYFGEIEAVAQSALDAVGYSGSGPVSERLLTDLAAHFGFTVEHVVDAVKALR